MWKWLLDSLCLWVGLVGEGEAPGSSCRHLCEPGFILAAEGGGVIS